jgi:phenylpropionate dioxygenase-like ring-hydroxylating dioxygenase large terminal subunit
MLTPEQNILLTQTGPGTPMGKLMRQYWLPVILSSETETDGAPVRVKLLGERLIAFRDTSGRVGLVDELCAHRRASLWLGRNEEDGIRCVYHGWKYDVNGNCLDMMNEPEDVRASFMGKVHLTSYPTMELGGVIWAYLGDGEVPPAPRFAWAQLPDTHRSVSRTWQESNWLQALEGGIDPAHGGILHRRISLNSRASGVALDSVIARGGEARIEVIPTSYGYRYFGVRPLPDRAFNVRAYHWILPFTQIRPERLGTDQNSGHMWVPMDDENCMVFNWRCSLEEALKPTEYVQHRDDDGPDNIDASNNFRKRRNLDNSWMIDRQVQKSGNFTGITGINTQDHAVQESMGPIVDRSKERLGPADRAIVAIRQILLDSTAALKNGETPPGVAGTYYDLFAYEQVFSSERGDWREVVDAAVTPPSLIARVPA